MQQPRRSIRLPRWHAWLLTLVIALAAATATPLSAAAVTTNGWAVQVEPHVYPIFWGNAWNSEPAAAERGKVMSFYNALNTATGSAWQGILTQYWAPKATKGEEATTFAFVSKTVLVGGAYVDTEGPPAGVTKANMEAEIAEAIEHMAKTGEEKWPKSISGTTVNDQFPIFLPTGTTWGGGIDDHNCGVHTIAESGAYAFAWIAWEARNKKGVLGPCSMTVTAAHEYAETVIDPGVGAEPAWDEIADICQEREWKTWAGGIEVPQLYDNEKEDCASSHENPAQKAPEIKADELTEIWGTQATLLGSAKTNGFDVTDFRFEWGLSKVTEHKGEWTLGSNLKFGAKELITGLEAGKTYRYRLVLKSAVSGVIPVEIVGAVNTFKTVSKPPDVTIEEPTGIEAGKATLHGSVNPTGLGTNYRFEWGETTAYGNKVEGKELKESKSQAVEAAIGGLKGNKTYFYRLVAESKDGKKEAKGSFATPDWSPVVETGEAKEAATKVYTVHGKVDPKGFATSYWVEYGEGGFEQSTKAKELTGSGSQEVAVNVEGLIGQKTYKYRLVASSEGNGSKQTNNGAGKEFTTPDWRPKVTVGVASAATTSTAALTGSVNPKGLTTEYHIEWGTKAEFEEGKYGHRMPEVGEAGIGSGTSDVEVSQSISGLEANKAYHFRVVATNGEGSTVGEDTPFRSQPLFSLALGGSSSGSGHLSAPAGVATDGEGNVWVADTSHDRIQEFNSKGEFVRQFGATGSGNGQLRSPRGVAIDSKGNLYVADTGNNRVQEFNSKGEYIRKWGSAGSGNGQFFSLQDLALDPEGHVWTLEGGSVGNNRVQEFSAEGTYVTGFGTAGSGSGQLASAKGIAISSSGSIWVADTGNNRIQKFNSKGELLYKFGSEGSGNGLFKAPQDVAFDSEGKIWVADAGNNRVQRLTTLGIYLAQLGTAGPNAGQFSEPQALTIDAKGNLWVADTGNDRVQETSATEFLLQFGGEGSGPGHLSVPAGIAVDSKGNTWVADTGHDRIQEFNSKGEFVRQFGATGSADGLLNAPRGVAIDSGGNLWVADTGNNRVQEFSSEGKFIRKFGTEGEGSGQFRGLRDLALDPEGHVWTLEGGSKTLCNNRLQEFSATGTYIASFGSAGSGDGQISTAKGIAIDSKGNVWVADTGNNRVEAFKSNGTFIRKWGSEGTGNEQFKAPQDLTVDPEGNLWVADTGNNRMQRFSSEGTYMAQFGTTGPNAGQFSEPQALTTDASGNVWIADTGNDRVQESTATEFLRAFGNESSGPGRLADPAGAALDASGNFWVADTAHNRIEEFNSKGELVRAFGGIGQGDGAFSEPKAVVVSPAGNLYVADTGNNRIQEFNSKGEYIRKWGSLGAGSGQFVFLRGLAVDPEGHVWTIESGVAGSGARIQKFSSEGAYLAQFGKDGTENGQLKSPQGIATDASGNVWVADTGNNRIQAFKPSGEFIRKFGTEGSGVGQLKSPLGLTFDPEGNVWVADAGNNRAEAFSPTGSYLVQFGVTGPNDGQISEPSGIAVDSGSNLWLAETGNDRVQRWGS